jgi:hypothetical protein
MVNDAKACIPKVFENKSMDNPNKKEIIRRNHLGV